MHFYVTKYTITVHTHKYTQKQTHMSTHNTHFLNLNSRKQTDTRTPNTNTHINIKKRQKLDIFGDKLYLLPVTYDNKTCILMKYIQY